ncbi:pupal cuticle protein 20 [Plutella xylostella]|uniref:pupal cuticle protein 20 n=1 Tax=Plutella xylostella TaxID=51655 RepID=UPI002032D78C|nr:pupal cuticle protein 20 [Plutella xylostella]
MPVSTAPAAAAAAAAPADPRGHDCVIVDDFGEVFWKPQVQMEFSEQAVILGGTTIADKLLVCLTAALASCRRLEPQYLPPRSGAYRASATAYASASASASAFADFRFDNQNNGDGSYRYRYDTPTGISAHESGSPRAVARGAAGAGAAAGAAVTAEGGYSYTAPDGQQISLTYTADEAGFHPAGAHLPTPPPIPDAILKSIEFNKRNPSNDEGAYRDSGYRY